MAALPDEKIMCHRTGFAVSCFDGVVKHKCRLWMHVSGLDASGNDIDVHGCADEFMVKMTHEVAKEIQQTKASVDKTATEVKKASDAAAQRDVLLINGVKASLPLLRIGDNNEKNGHLLTGPDDGGSG